MRHRSSSEMGYVSWSQGRYSDGTMPETINHSLFSGNKTEPMNQDEQDNKPKIYIAGKIGFLPEHEYIANFKQGKIEAAAAGYTPLSPVDLPHDHDRTWKSYMKEDLRALKECDAIYMLSNWKDSRGARIEHWFAKRYGKILLFQTVQKKRMS